MTGFLFKNKGKRLIGRENKKISVVKVCICLTAFFLLWGHNIGFATQIKSPDGRIVLDFVLDDTGTQKDCPVYSISFRGKPVLAKSRLGFDLESGMQLGNGLAILSTATSGHDTTWHPVYGERSTVRDNYNQLIVRLRQKKSPHYRMDITFRCYDSGAAFRTTIHKTDSVNKAGIAKENSEFRFLGDHVAWSVPTAQGIYRKTRLSQIDAGAERPLTIQIDDSIFVALAEARLVNYARMKFSPSRKTPFCLVSQLSGTVNSPLPLTTPWRVIMIAESPGQLLENNDIILNLNDPCAIKKTSWIKPGKVIRETTLTTDGGKAYVDFAAAHHLQYVEYDAGWYGYEYADSSDATTITVDPKRSPGPLDLHEVIRYAKERGIGIILYVNRRALERQIDQILPLYKQWGIKGLKYGFVQVGSQKWTAWLHEAIRKAAQNELMVDVHDEYRPTGYSRTYPNLMTQEGISGDETAPTNTQTLTVLFTRMLAGAADNTICYYDHRVDEKATHAYQLAKAVCLYSPWQFLYWYDRPAKKGSSELQKNILGNEPELEFFDAVPTVWDDTKVLHGKIGEYAVIARRSGKNWFIGCMNSGQARTFDIPLDFLKKGKKYVAAIYSDDPSVQTRTHVKITRYLVSPETVLKAAMSEKGGQAIMLVPASGKDQFPVYE